MRVLQIHFLYRIYLLSLGNFFSCWSTEKCGTFVASYYPVNSSLVNIQCQPHHCQQSQLMSSLSKWRLWMFQFTVTKVKSVLESEGLVTVIQMNPNCLKIGAIYYTLANFIALGIYEHPSSHLCHSLNTRCFLRHFFTIIPYVFMISSISVNFSILHFTCHLLCFFFKCLNIQCIHLNLRIRLHREVKISLCFIKHYSCHLQGLFDSPYTDCAVDKVWEVISWLDRRVSQCCLNWYLHKTILSINPNPTFPHTKLMTVCVNPETAVHQWQWNTCGDTHMTSHSLPPFS